jgi:hypothetical protein
MLSYHLLTEHISKFLPDRVAALQERSTADIMLCSRNSAERRPLEAFIQDGFQRKHGATVNSFMPVLIGLRDAAGAIVGAAGYRPAAQEPLYLEQYLGASIEDLIAQRHPNQGATRAQVAEIGNFACRDCSTALTMVSILAEFLLDQRHRWAVFTATRTVRGIMRHLGISLTEMGRADKSRVAVAGDEWGSYYANDPRVMLGYVLSYRGNRDLTWSI